MTSRAKGSPKVGDLEACVRQLVGSKGKRSPARALVLALVELGHTLACEMPHCIQIDRTFEPTGTRGLSIDHIDGTWTDHPSNLRLAHAGCNSSAANLNKTKQPLSVEHKAKISASLQGKVKTKEHRENISRGMRGEDYKTISTRRVRRWGNAESQ